MEQSVWLSAFEHGGLCVHLYTYVSDIALYILGNWRNNLEDWAAEDWNEDVGDFCISLLFYPASTLASNRDSFIYMLNREPHFTTTDFF